MFASVSLLGTIVDKAGDILTIIDCADSIDTAQYRPVDIRILDIDMVAGVFDLGTSVLVSGLTIVDSDEDWYLLDAGHTQVMCISSETSSPCKLFSVVRLINEESLTVVEHMPYDGGDYSGEVDSNGLPHGRGELKLSAKCWYKGEWWHGKKSGKGLFHHPLGSHEGRYESGVKHGHGEARIASTEYTFHGTFNNDIPILSVHDARDSQCLDALSFCSFTR